MGLIWGELGAGTRAETLGEGRGAEGDKEQHSDVNIPIMPVSKEGKAPSSTHLSMFTLVS